MISALKNTSMHIRTRWQARSAAHASYEADKLPIREKAPLALALVAQSYVVFNWYRATTHGIDPTVDFIVALAAGAALDWLVVSTVMGRREGRTSIWSWLTSVAAFICSALIALDSYAGDWTKFDVRSMLHVAFPLVVLLYSLHLASPRKHIPVQSQEGHSATKSLELTTGTLPAVTLARPAEPVAVYQQCDTVRLAPVVAPITTEAPTPAAYACPACGAPLSLGAYGSAKRYGYCKACKLA